MKKLIASLAFAIAVTSLPAQTYTPSDDGSEIKFSIKNFGLTVNGSFKGLKGKINFNPANITTASFNASVQVATINTGNGSRDNHLKKEEYFDASKFPVINFVLTRISKSTKAGTLQMEGKITIKGVTKVVSFPFTATPKMEGFLFAGSFKLNRRDFGVGGKSLVLSDTLTVELAVFANK